MVMCDYFTTFTLYSLYFVLWDTASFKVAILILFSTKLFIQVGIIFYLSLVFR